jgi:hypothetical protein
VQTESGSRSPFLFFLLVGFMGKHGYYSVLSKFRHNNPRHFGSGKKQQPQMSDGEKLLAAMSNRTQKAPAPTDSNSVPQTIETQERTPTLIFDLDSNGRLTFDPVNIYNLARTNGVIFIKNAANPQQSITLKAVKLEPGMQPTTLKFGNPNLTAYISLLNTQLQRLGCTLQPLQDTEDRQSHLAV